MKLFSLLILFLSFYSSSGQTTESLNKCELPIYINPYGSEWYLDIEKPHYNDSMEIKNQYGVFKIKLEECMGKIHLTRFSGDTLLEQGTFFPHRQTALDTIFKEDEMGDIYPVPYPHLRVHKIGEWKYWAPKDYFIQKF